MSLTQVPPLTVVGEMLSDLNNSLTKRNSLQEQFDSIICSVGPSLWSLKLLKVVFNELKTRYRENKNGNLNI